MREIELKFQVEDIREIVAFLEANNCTVSPAERQHDTIYVKDLSNTKSSEGSVWLRVRRTDNAVELNYKKQSVNRAESEEIEFEVGSEEKAKTFLRALGFKEWVQVKKQRRYSKYKGYNICIDKVEGLGEFVEVEVLVEGQDSVDYEKRLLGIAKEMGISTRNIVKNHYDTMLAELRR